MALAEDIKSEITNILRGSWTERDGRGVPEDVDIGLGNHAVNLDAAALYADLVDSSGLVASRSATFAAEIYKCYLLTACRVIRKNRGTITAFDGDRVMAVYVGRKKNSAAARTALQINYAIKEIVNPAITARYPNESYSIKHVVGVDSGKLLVAKTGVRGSNDLVWVGSAANTAAKLCAIREGGASWITSRVYRKMASSVKSTDGRSMWKAWSWNDSTVYRSSWTWAL